ncbi:MAG: DUF2384 domain-containing protein [Nitrococcus sp.]|nr:DUF2384 domain-containing protein [Nitrococcus sp.]
MRENPVGNTEWLRAMRILGGVSLERQAERQGAVRVIRSGISSAAIKAFALHARFAQKDILALLGVPKSTYQRIEKSGGNLSVDVSDRLFRIARLTVQAQEVFEDEDTALDWLRSPNQALAGETPYGLLDTDAGAGAVEAELIRIEYGVYS